MKRRDLLRTLALGALAAALPVAWLARGTGLPAVRTAGGTALPPLRRYGRHYLVNGWLLTARDLEAMRRHDA